MIAITVFNIGTNTTLMIIKTVGKLKLGFKQVRYKIRLFLYKRKLKRAEKYYLNE